MLAYILRRLLLMIPTILGIIAVYLRDRAIRAGRASRVADRRQLRGGRTGAVRRRRRPDRLRRSPAGGDVWPADQQGARSGISSRSSRNNTASTSRLKGIDSGARLFDVQLRQELLSRRASAELVGKNCRFRSRLACGSIACISYAISIPLWRPKGGQGRLPDDTITPRSSSLATQLRAFCSRYCWLCTVCGGSLLTDAAAA